MENIMKYKDAKNHLEESGFLKFSRNKSMDDKEAIFEYMELKGYTVYRLSGYGISHNETIFIKE